MLDSLINLLVSFIEDVIPFRFVKQYDNGIFLRCGKFRKVVKPGLIWKFPFFEKIETQTIVTTTLSVPTQSVMTKDMKSLVVKAMVRYRVIDVEAFMLKVYDAQDAIADTTQSIVKEQILERVWADCLDNELDNTITKKVRTAVRHWGLEIEKVTLTDMGLIKSLRLFNEAGALG